MKRAPIKRGVTRDQVLRELSYSPSTGVFTWVSTRPIVAGRFGQVAGCVGKQGYVTIILLGRGYLAHRLAWLVMTGEHPPSLIDHRDHDKSNNRWLNLRLATDGQNKAHTGMQRNNTSGFKGVSWHPNGRWIARCNVSGKTHVVGWFGCPREAADAYDDFAVKHHGEFAVTNSSLRSGLSKGVASAADASR